jgi:Family of unknown function (DUF6455)
MFGLSREVQRRSPIGAILAWCRQLAKGWSPASDLECCGEIEIERMARDIRMSASELRAIMKLGPDAADLLQRRMAALDLDPKEVSRIEPETLRDLQRVCALCRSHRRCARDFAHKAATETWNEYCPNTDTLAALSAMPWVARREW